MRTVLQPEGWPRPKGYSNGIAAKGTMVFTAGVVGWTPQEIFEYKNLVDQCRQAFENTKAILNEAKAKPEHIVRMTWYITDKKEYTDNLKEIGILWREIFGKIYPCMACVEVSALIEDDAKIEIEITAVLPEE